MFDPEATAVRHALSLQLGAVCMRTASSYLLPYPNTSSTIFYLESDAAWYTCTPILMNQGVIRAALSAAEAGQGATACGDGVGGQRQGVFLRGNDVDINDDVDDDGDGRGGALWGGAVDT